MKASVDKEKACSQDSVLGNLTITSGCLLPQDQVRIQECDWFLQNMFFEGLVLNSTPHEPLMPWLAQTNLEAGNAPYVDPSYHLYAAWGSGGPDF